MDAVRPDLAHGNSLAIGRLLGPVKTLAGVCTVAHLRDIMKLSAKAVGDLNQNTRLLAVSEATRTFHIGQGLSASRTIVVYNGVDGDQFRPRPKNVELRRQLSVSADAIMVLTVGQIGLRKGLDVLADAAVQIVADHHRMQFVVVGERNSSKAESIEFERQFVATFEAAGVRDHLHLTGYRHDVAQLMSESDLLVHPARQEPFGRVLLEAAATGLPIVATAVGGTEEMLVDGENARFVVPDDPRALESAVVELILDVPLRHRLGAAARRHVRRCFSKSQAASDLNRVWRDVIRG